MAAVSCRQWIAYLASTTYWATDFVTFFYYLLVLFVAFLYCFGISKAVVFKLRLLSPAGDGLRSSSLQPSINLTVGNAGPAVATVA